MSLESSWKVFIQPPRQTYTQYDLGPQHFRSDAYQVQRIEFATRNSHKSLLRGSYYQIESHPSSVCVLYMHSFNGCKVEAVQLAQMVTAQGLNFCMFDFQAAGLSEGTYVTFGVNERHDITAIKTHLEATYGIDKFIFWGRSMGATTSLLHCLAGNANVCALVLDSPFHDLNKLTIRMIQKQYTLPKLIIKGFLGMIKGQIESTARFTFDQVKLPTPLKIETPALFMASKKDSIIPYKYIDKVYKSYQGQKQLFELGCDHKDNRSSDVLARAIQWIMDVVGPQAPPSPRQRRNTQFERTQPKMEIQTAVASSRVPEGSKIKDRIIQTKKPQQAPLSVNASLRFERSGRLTPKQKIYDPPRLGGQSSHQFPDIGRIDHIKRKYAYLLQQQQEMHQTHSKERVSNAAYKLKQNIQRELSPDLRVVNRVLLQHQI